MHQDFKYLNLPVMAQYGWGKKLRTFVRAGVYTGLLLKRNSNLERIADRLVYVPGSHVAQERSWDWGAVAGAGLELEVAPRLHVGLQSNVQLGLRDWGFDPYIDISTRSRHISADLGVGINYTLTNK